MTCPACKAHTSSVRAAFLDHRPCPSCGLSAYAAQEILAIRQRHADAEADLTARCAQLVIRADRAEMEEGRTRATLKAIADLLEEWRPT